MDQDDIDIARYSTVKPARFDRREEDPDEPPLRLEPRWPLYANVGYAHLKKRR